MGETLKQARHGCSLTADKPRGVQPHYLQLCCYEFKTGLACSSFIKPKMDLGHSLSIRSMKRLISLDSLNIARSNTPDSVNTVLSVFAYHCLFHKVHFTKHFNQTR